MFDIAMEQAMGPPPIIWCPERICCFVVARPAAFMVNMFIGPTPAVMTLSHLDAISAHYMNMNMNMNLTLNMNMNMNLTMNMNMNMICHYHEYDHCRCGLKTSAV
jgi:hypothetical protein